MSRPAAWLLCLLCMGTATPLIGEETVQIQSDTLSVIHEKKQARFKGNVRAVLGELQVTCESLVIFYDDAGEIRNLKAKGGVTVIHKQIRATAASATLDAPSGRLVLSGSPVLVRDGQQLKGKRIVVELHSGRLDMTEAKGTFVLKKGAP